MTERSPEAAVEPLADIEQIEVDAPRVGIVMGSKSDIPAMEPAERTCRSAGSAAR